MQLTLKACISGFHRNELNTKLDGNTKFKTCTGWLIRFKSKCGIPELEIVEEKLSVDNSAAKQFVKVFANGGEKS